MEIKKSQIRIAIWALIGVLFVATVFFAFKAGTSASLETAQAAGSAAKTAASSYGGMVGGC